MAVFTGAVAAVRAVRQAFAPVDRWMSPQHRYGRPPAAVVRWARIRTAGSILATVAAGAAYPSVEALHGLIGRPMTSVALAVPALVVAGAVLLVATSRPRRPAMARALTRPGGKALLVAAGWAVWLVGANGLTPLRPLFDALTDVHILLAMAVWIVVIGFWALVVAPVTLYASFLALRHWFGGADVHPMLPALCAAAFGVAHLVRLVVDGLDGGRPVWVGLLLGLGAPFVLIGLAVVELRLVRRSGVSLRDLPQR